MNRIILKPFLRSTSLLLSSFIYRSQMDVCFKAFQKFAWIVILLASYSYQAYGQISDSVMQEINAISEDSSRVRACLDLYRSSVSSNPANSLDYSRLAYNMAYSENVEEYLRVETALTLSTNFDYLNMPDSQHYYLKIIKDNHEQYLESTPQQHAAFYHSMGSYCLQVDQLDSASYFYSLAIENAYEARDTLSVIRAMSNQVQVFTQTHQERKAIDLLMEVLDYATAKSDSMIIAHANFNLGYIYDALRQFEKSAFYYEQAEKYVALPFPRRSIFNNLGSVYLSLGDTITALKMYENAQEIDIQISGEMATSEALLGIGVITLYYKKQPDEALIMLNKCLEVAREKGLPYSQAMMLNVLADAYVQIKQLGKARQHVEEAHTLALEYNYPDIEATVLKTKSTIEAAAGNSNLAYEYMLEYTSLQDEIHEQARSEEVADAETRYQSAKKEQENALLKQEALFNGQQIQAKNRQLWLLILFLAAILLSSFLLLINYRKRIALNKILENRNSELKQLNRNKDLLVRMVSHDLRTPLGYINNWINMLQMMPAFKDSNFAQYLKDIQQSVEHLESVTSRILRSAGKENDGEINPQSDTFDLRNALQNWIRLMQPEALKKNIDILLEVPEEPVVIKSDPMLNQQCIDNLVSNAVKYTSEGGQVSIRLKKPEDGYVKIEIEDTGQGISPEVQEKIFEPFFNAPKHDNTPVESFGLGLYNVKQYLDLLNGKISVESQLGKGSTFMVEWPVGN